MTAVSDLRDRLAGAIRLHLGHAGFTIDASVASRIADAAVVDAGLEGLTGYVAAVEAGADPTAARDLLAGDPILSDLLVTP